MVHPDNGILLALERNKLSSHEKTCRNLKELLSERSPFGKVVSFQLCDVLEKAKLWRQNDQWLSGVGGQDG